MGKLLSEVFTPVAIFRMFLGAIVAGVTAWGVSFYVADYVAKASITGLTTAVEGLQSSVNTLQASVQQVNGNMLVEARSLRLDRDQITKDIAQQVADLQKGQRDSIADLTKALTTTNGELATLNASINGLSGTVRVLDERLSTSIQRQTGFEQLVTSILVRNGPPPPLKQNWFGAWGFKDPPQGFDVQFLESDPKLLERYLITYGTKK